MFKKKNQEQGRGRQPVIQDRQAFSYYTSTRPTPQRVEDRRIPEAPRGQSIQPPKRGSVWLRYFVLILCFGVAAICLFKLLLLVPSSRVVISSDMPSHSSTSTQTYKEYANTLLSKSLTNRTKVTLDTTGIAEQMKLKFPELESVVVTVPIVGNKPVIYIAPAHAVMRLETASGSYLLSSKGYAFNGDGSSVTKADLPQLIDLSGVRPSADKPFLPLSTVEFANTISYQLNKANIQVESMLLPQEAPYELDVRVAGKPYAIKFNLEEDAMTQSGAAVALIRKIGTTTPDNYIDVRVPGRAYYK